MSSFHPRRGRPPEVPPHNYVTLDRAAELAGVSYATVYRAIQKDLVGSHQADNGARFVLARDVPKIKRRADNPPRRVYLPGVTDAQIKRWKRAAADAGAATLSEWAREILDSSVARIR